MGQRGFHLPCKEDDFPNTTGGFPLSCLLHRRVNARVATEGLEVGFPGIL